VAKPRWTQRTTNNGPQEWLWRSGWEPCKGGGWRHPRLEFEWPEDQALLLELDALALEGEATALLGPWREREKEARRRRVLKGSRT